MTYLPISLSSFTAVIPDSDLLSAVNFPVKFPSSCALCWRAGLPLDSESVRTTAPVLPVTPATTPLPTSDRDRRLPLSAPLLFRAFLSLPLAVCRHVSDAMSAVCCRVSALSDICRRGSGVMLVVCCRVPGVLLTMALPLTVLSVSCLGLSVKLLVALAGD